MKRDLSTFSYFRLPKRVTDLEDVVFESALEDITSIGKSLITASTQALARQAIGAVSLGTTASTAKAGNYVPSATEVLTAIQAMNETQKTAVKTALGL